MRLTKVLTAGVLFAAVSCLTVGWALFAAMWVRGVRKITLYVNLFSEFWIELAILSAAMIFVPVAAVEFDRYFQQNRVE